MKKGNEISSYLENFSLLIWGIFFLSLPLIFATFTTEIFILPKQILLGTVLLITILFFGIKMISDGTVRLRRTPFDLPVFLFALFVFLSSILSLNRFESLIAFVPLLLAIIAYFTIVNFVKTKESLMFMIYSLITGSVI